MEYSFSSYIKMERNIQIPILLLCLLTLAAAGEWYEEGHHDLLTWQTFDAATMEKGKYKYVKFFTRTCRYCRMMKLVQEQLRAERQWGFKFYEVDCSIHFDLCNAKISIPSFPFVGVYNIKGELEGSVGGYYPIETCREAFNIIEKRQIDAVAILSPQTKVENIVQLPTVANDISDVKIEDMKDEKQKQMQVQKKIEKDEKTIQTAQINEKDKSRQQQISLGIKICAILLGIWIYNTTVKPYLSLEDSQTKTRLLYIPLKANNENRAEQAKLPQQRYCNFSSFPDMSDTI